MPSPYNHYVLIGIVVIHGNCELPCWIMYSYVVFFFDIIVVEKKILRRGSDDFSPAGKGEGDFKPTDFMPKYSN